MMASPSELSFDCKPQIYSMLPKSFGDQASEHTQKLEEFVARLEEEKLKIDAFKRELPLCMQLLTNAMEASRQQLQSERASQGGRPVLEEFIPLKNMNASCNVEMSNEGNISADKANWMTSAQLWNQESEGGAKAPQSSLQPPKESDIKLGLNNSKLQRVNGGGAFLPFSSKDRGSSPSGEGYPELALSSNHKEEMAEEKRNSSEIKRESAVKSDEKEQGCGTATNGGQTHRKARRCWSPDLHRRFVNALHMLGGSQVATPKQIRELMKVDGLTNDEVKSHLQKYRLHTRRPSPSPQSAVTAAPQVVVLGGIWVPPEYAAAAAAHGGAHAAALYGSAHPHHHVSSSPFCSSNPAVAQDMYPAIAPPPNHQLQYHQQQQQQLHLYSKAPVTQRNSSPESEIRGGAGNPSESIEDGKSESGSWKADSGCDNSGERRRVEGEESNASVVSLKF